ncbi:MAG: FAD-binding oxidoreductase, partial [Actinocrinis sp.]
LTLARRTLRHLLDVLDPYIARGTPIVVPEPSCLASFRDELPKLLCDDPRAARLAALARSPAEHLLATGGVSILPRADEPRRVLIHPHCHARAVHAADADRRLLEAVGHQVSILDAGCCGLAGSFGFSAKHEALSRTIGRDQWLPKLVAATPENGELVIDGFSCAMQYSHLAAGSTPDGAPAPTTLPELLLGRVRG